MIRKCVDHAAMNTIIQQPDEAVSQIMTDKDDQKIIALLAAKVLRNIAAVFNPPVMLNCDEE